MNAKRLILTSLFIELLALAAPGRAYDIDIYSTVAISATPPNIMIVIDNPSSQNNAVGACTYYDGTTPSNNGQALGADQCALVNLVHNLATKPDGTAQLALGLTTMSGVDMPLTPVNDNTYTGVSPVIISGVSVTIPGGTTNRNAIIMVVKAITQTTGKSGQGSMLQETWAYYTDGNGTYGGVNTATGLLSGRTYPTPAFPATNATTGCQKNYIIYLSNVKAGASHAQTWTTSELSVLDAAAHNAVTGGAYGTPTNTTNTTFLRLDPSAAGYTGVIAYPTQEAQYGLEWARFMFATDINNVSTGSQTIVTYSIGTGDTAPAGSAITNNMEQYIDDVAIYGGGKYYPAGTDPATLQNDILKIFNEVQAVNSVFASSSLPVSVNAQGTFLNQVYMGMFRPDPNGLPRWFGNLKQYQFGLNQTTNSLYLADSLNNSAISSAGTGFISPNAISFWTCTALGATPYPDPYVNTYLSAAQVTQLVQDLQSCTDPLPNGFWANNPDSINAIAKGFDLADGERVERGGTAQQIRQANLTDNYTYATETTQNPRQLYTWCPSGSGCSATFENSSPNPNVFDTSNAAITDAQLGTGPKAITSITSAATVSLTSAAPYGAAPFGVGGVNPTITILSLSKSSSTATATVSAADLALLWVGAQVKISTGATKYDCNPCTVASINTTNNTFTYSNSGGSGNPTTPSTASIYENYVEFYNPGVMHSLTPGMLVTISGCTIYTGINGLVGAVSSQWIGVDWFVIAVATPLTFTGWDSTCKYTPNTATVTTSVPHGFSPQEVVTIAGATPAGYNGAWVVTPTGNYTFTYQYTVQAPLANWTSAGATASSGSITRDALTKWVRGDDNYGDEASLCPPGTAAGTGNCPNPAVTIRPSVHGDVLHSRPTVLNYGYFTGNIISTADSGTTRTATLSPADIANLSATGFAPVVTFANGDACAVTVTSGTTISYLNVPVTTCGNAGAQTITFGSKVVVYYGDNSGVFHAVNGNRSQTMGSAGPGDEIWGFIPKEFFPRLKRLMGNSPIVQMPSTPTGITPTPTPKDWFVDGAPGVYQTIDGNGNTLKAILYLAMRRGTDSNNKGFMYALDVTTPANPAVLWKLDSTGVTSGTGAFTASTANAELGQTWSQPKVAFINGYCNSSGAATPPACSSTNLPSPVLIIGGGYDPNEDNEPMSAMDSQGRAIFILDALTGKVIWSVSPTGSTGCASGTTPPCHVAKSSMVYSIPSDITLVDRDNDGNVDRLYATDTGGNVWRVDLEPPKTNALGVSCSSSSTAGCTPDVWTPYLIAALGGFTGPCYGGTVGACNPTQRKFFYPAEVITATANNNFDAVIVGSGDREHPLYVNTSTQRYNRIFLLKDMPGNDGSIATNYPMTLAGTNFLLDCTNFSNCLLPNGTGIGSNCTSSLYNGYYVTLGAGEKVVNAPLVVAGIAYMGTNTPSSPSASCIANLGVAKGYALSPLSCSLYSQVFAGGGMPPSPVAGVVDVVVNGVVRREPFLIGGVNPNCVGSDCSSAEGAQKPPISVPTTRHRNYRYIKGK